MKKKPGKVQDWFPIESFLEKGIIKLKDKSLIKIIKIFPINYNLKSDLEKEVILTSYKNLFKSFNSNFQIVIQSKKEDLSKAINLLKISEEYEEYKEKYIEYILKQNKNKKSSSKNFYIILKDVSEENEEVKIQNLSDLSIKLKDLLSRTGNTTTDLSTEDEIIEMISSFLIKSKRST